MSDAHAARAADACRAYLAHIERVEGYSPETVRAYGEHLQAFCRWCDRESIDALHVGQRELRAYLAYLGAAHYATRTIAAHLSSIRSFFTWCSSEGLVAQNASALMQMPKMPQVLPTTVSAAELDRLFDEADERTPEGLRDRAMLELFYATGARISELARTSLSDIDRASGTVRLFGKGSKERIVPVHQTAFEAADTYIVQARPELLSRASDPAGRHERALFISARGRAMDAAALRYRFQKLCRRAGLPPEVTPHTMRHTFATDLLQGGADLRSVQELLGHASLSTTTLYTHLTPERLKDAMRLAHPRAEDEGAHGDDAQ